MINKWDRAEGEFDKTTLAFLKTKRHFESMSKTYDDLITYAEKLCAKYKKR
jgi:hypothetical protein